MQTKSLIAAILTAAVAASVAGCAVGDGTGSAKGQLFMLGCMEGDPYGAPGMPTNTDLHDYDLQPSYFVGEPIEDISDGPPANVLIIRMQRNGNALEITDTLYFNIGNSRDVAQCLRGRTVNGVPDWDTTSTGTVDPTVTTPWCGAPVPPPDGSGLPRIYFRQSGPVGSSFTPLGTCISSAHPPHIVSITGVAQDGWIDFLNFGNAEQDTTPPDMRSEVETDFKVDFGQRLRANFHIDMGDDRVQTAMKLGINPPPDPTIGGFLDGTFDFDLTRGQGAQSFP